MKRYAALFDLDGVLIDSESTYSKFWTEIDREYPTGYPDYAMRIKGTTLPMILKDFPESLHEEIVRRIKEFQDNMVFTPYDGARDFLAQLRERGFGIALVTSSDSSKMAELYRQQPWMRQAFDCIIDASMVTRSKPDPQGYLLAASRLGYSPEDCFVFEDSLQGLKAGRASGATVIGIATTYPEEHLQGLADEIYDSVASIDIDHLESLKK